MSLFLLHEMRTLCLAIPLPKLLWMCMHLLSVSVGVQMSFQRPKSSQCQPLKHLQLSLMRQQTVQPMLGSACPVAVDMTRL